MKYFSEYFISQNKIKRKCAWLYINSQRTLHNGTQLCSVSSGHPRHRIYTGQQKKGYKVICLLFYKTE